MAGHIEIEVQFTKDTFWHPSKTYNLRLRKTEYG
jgi:hypothetical protein